MDFTLPSGRTLALNTTVTWGDEVDASEAKHKADDSDVAYWNHMQKVVAGLSDAEVRDLSREDGFALFFKVIDVVRGRREEEEAPFAPASTPTT